MKNWIHWWEIVKKLRPAFSRERTFLWFCVALIGLTIRTDNNGVTSIVRALGLTGSCYGGLIGMFHSSAITLDFLASLWVNIVLEHFPNVHKVNGRIVLIGDGIKIPKEGKKMPAVKSLHQDSESNSKSEYIMGHSCQAISLLCGTLGYFFAVPLTCRIHEGIVFSNRDKRTLLDKMLILLESLMIAQGFYFVADAYYASGKIIKGLLSKNQHLIGRARINAVAYSQPLDRNKKKRGRPKKYGKRIKIFSLFKSESEMVTSNSPVYGENDVKIKYLEVDLLWKPAGCLVKFILVIHPYRGKMILLSTDLKIDPLTVIALYGRRYKIEVGFKQAIHTFGSYAYHFWMKAMKPIKRCSGNQHLHHENEKYRKTVLSKLSTFHCFMQAGIIAQGLTQYLSMTISDNIWKTYGSWIRTIRPNILPSEWITAKALRNTLSEFLPVKGDGSILKKFIIDRIDFKRKDGQFLLVA